MNSCYRAIEHCLYRLRRPLPPTTHSTDAIESPRYESLDDPTTCCEKFFNLFTASASSAPDHWSLRDSVLKDIDPKYIKSASQLSLQELLNLSTSSFRTQQ